MKGIPSNTFTFTRMEEFLLAFVLFIFAHFANAYNTETIQNCSDLSDVSVRNLTFPGGEISQITNLTWGQEEFGPQIDCVTKFVLLYDWADDSGVLCPSFNITKIDQDTYGCLANFSSNACNRTIQLSLEAWTNNSMFQSAYGHVYINCNLTNMKLLPEPPIKQTTNLTNTQTSPGLADAVFSLLESIVPVLTGSSITISNCSWTTWSSWSICSKTCGDTSGNKTRTRHQSLAVGIGDHCNKTETETEKCLLNKCPVDCTWSTWTDWSQCSQSCGSGLRTRSRIVSESEKFGGKSCLDSDRNETESCIAHTCPVHGQWGEWKRWTYCNVTCGNGHKTRIRSCDNPKAENGGFECTGEEKQVTECEALRKCQPINGGWTIWSKWSGCSASCGKGAIVRSRSCTNPKPQYDGNDCFGGSLQNRSCYLRKCVADPEQNETIISNGNPEVQTETAGKESNTIITNAEVKRNCLNVPYVYGFLGPEKVGDKAKYSCYYGLVIDIVTNRKEFKLPCDPTDDFEFPTNWPKCIQPTHCVGPARKSIQGLRSPFPIRDVPVLSEIKYQCENVSNKSVSGSCFLDGYYRYPEGFSECSENMTNTYHIDNNSSNIQISVTGSSQYGWIEGSNSTINFIIRNGILIKVGIESNLDETNSFKVNSERKDVKDKIVQLHENSVLEIIGQFRLHYISYDA